MAEDMDPIPDEPEELPVEELKFDETTDEVTSDDRLWAAISYPIFIVAIIVLLLEDKKARPFIKYHAVQALLFNAMIWVASILLSVTVIGGCLVPLLWLATFWPAYEAYQGKYLEIPYMTKFARDQGWL